MRIFLRLIDEYIISLDPRGGGGRGAGGGPGGGGGGGGSGEIIYSSISRKKCRLMWSKVVNDRNGNQLSEL